MAWVRSDARHRVSWTQLARVTDAMQPLAQIRGEAHLERAVGHRLPAAEPAVARDQPDVEHEHGDQVQRKAKPAEGGRDRTRDRADAPLLDVDADEVEQGHQDEEPDALGQGSERGEADGQREPPAAWRSASVRT